jgi:hypothetical protein
MLWTQDAAALKQEKHAKRKVIVDIIPIPAKLSKHIAEQVGS